MKLRDRLAKLERDVAPTSNARREAAEEAALLQQDHERMAALATRAGIAPPTCGNWNVNRLREIAAMSEIDAAAALAEYRAGAPARFAVEMIQLIERRKPPYNENTKALLAQLRAVAPSPSTTTRKRR